MTGERDAGAGVQSNLPLIISLCLNIALAATVIAAVLIALHRLPPQGLLTSQGLMRAATPSEQTRMQAIVATHAARIKELRRADFQARQAAFRLFAGPEFSLPRFAKALADLRAAENALRAEQTEVVAECAAQLSPSERAAVASSERRRLTWWRFVRGLSGK